MKSEAASIFVFPATGTGGWETAITNTLSPGDRVLVARYGMFSHRWIDMCQRHGLDVSVIETPWGSGAPVDRYEEILTADKAHQKADWARRPLTPEQIDYARHDTHHLVALRDLQIEALKAAGLWEEAQEDFARLARLSPGAPVGVPDPLAFWRVKGAFDLTPAQAAALIEAWLADRRWLG